MFKSTISHSGNTFHIIREFISLTKPRVNFLIMFILIAIVGVFQSWTVAFMIINMCIISAIMSLGVNIQWGYAGLFNIGIISITQTNTLTKNKTYISE